MHIEDEAPDWRRRIGAIVHQFRPIRIAVFDGIHPEGAQQIEGMTRRELSPGERRAQGQRGFDGIALPGQGCLEKVESGKLGVRRERRTVGDVVGAPRETVIGKNCGAMFWRDEHGGDGKVFLPVRFRRIHRQAGRHRSCPLPRNHAKASLRASG